MATSKLIKTFTRLRVLSLKHYKITKLPDLIGELKRLRYLDLSNTSIKVLPESIATLYNLLTLLLQDCRYLAELPRDMGNLVNLRDLDISGTDLQQFPPHMGRLKNLRTLPYFIVSRDGGSGIVELKDMSNLQGDLCIRGLESVDIEKDAVGANLLHKKYLNKLVLEWISDFDDTIPKSLDSLKSLEISNCIELSWIPCIAQIQNLVLVGCDQTILETVVDLTSLEKLLLHKVLKLKHLPNELFHGLTALSDLEIGNCDELTVLFNMFGLLCNTSLKRLKIWKCSLNLLWPEEEYGLPHLLEGLEISDCMNLTSLPEKLHSLKSLKTMKIINCPRLVALPEMDSPSNLRYLQIKECEALQSLPKGLMHNENLSLEVLEIDGCSSLKCFAKGELPLTLQKLKITNCSNLNDLPAGLLSKNTCLECLQISGCSLTSFPLIFPRPLQSSSSDSSPRLKVLEASTTSALKSCFSGEALNYNFSES
ncbi:hypothetical protein LWI28_013624 [Acer negundo]|uniref:Disease resistance R13L4/SHOC-2-like LRR domain-containing protein n=1 Tax=Acer negundo TaxID=4023 RepID=A0AAD5IMJ7_ACENE|nr:hypothetical protein LWI28_013624 [Acer negundo]